MAERQLWVKLMAPLLVAILLPAFLFLGLSYRAIQTTNDHLEEAVGVSEKLIRHYDVIKIKFKWDVLENAAISGGVMVALILAALLYWRGFIVAPIRSLTLVLRRIVHPQELWEGPHMPKDNLKRMLGAIQSWSARFEQDHLLL